MSDELKFCGICRIAAVNCDFSPIDYHYNGDDAEAKYQRVVDGLERLGWVIHGDTVGDPEEEERDCDCCGDRWWGKFWPFHRDQYEPEPPSPTHIRD